jgi:hypothetical protein
MGKGGPREGIGRSFPSLAGRIASERCIEAIKVGEK